MTAHSDFVFETVADMQAVRSEWSALAERSSNLFGTWDWAESWWRHFGAGALSVVVCRGPDGAAAAVLPLHLVRGQVRLLGHGPSDELGPICAPGDRDAAARALRRYLASAPFPWECFVGDDMPDDLGWDVVLGGRVVARRAGPVLRADGMDWPAFLATRSANFRGQVRSRERRLRQRYDVVLRETENEAELERDLDTLFRLHVARWGWPDAAKFAGPQARAFMEEFASTAVRHRWLRLRVLELDGRAAAATLNFRFGGAEWYYQGGRDPSLAHASVGFVLQAHAVREALNEGVGTYRFLRGDESYKRRFADDDAGVMTVRVDKEPTGER
jgi:CelD/BcsL family acetyltransferase involved in cellulose biosynthesis